jgi:hypothetical protein
MRSGDTSARGELRCWPGRASMLAGAGGVVPERGSGSSTRAPFLCPASNRWWSFCRCQVRSRASALRIGGRGAVLRREAWVGQGAEGQEVSAWRCCRCLTAPGRRLPDAPSPVVCVFRGKPSTDSGPSRVARPCSPRTVPVKIRAPARRPPGTSRSPAPRTMAALGPPPPPPRARWPGSPAPLGTGCGPRAAAAGTRPRTPGAPRPVSLPRFCPRPTSTRGEDVDGWHPTLLGGT